MARVLIVRGGTRDSRRYNYHLHEGFFEGAFRRAGHEVFHYGAVARGTKDGPIKFLSGRPVREVAKALKADLCLGIELNPPVMLQGLRGYPRVAYVCDLHRVKSLEMLGGADMMLVRARAFSSLVPKLPGGKDIRSVHWLPFSFDQEKMDAVPEPKRRYPLVTFGGSIRSEPWPVRRAAILALHDAALMSPEARVMRHDPVPDYFRSLKSSMIGLTCSTRWKLNPAKHFEIPAAGCLLLTDGPPGMDAILPKELYRVYRPNNVVALVKSLVSTKAALSEVAELGRRSARWCREHHSDEVRGRQLMALLTRHKLL